MPEPASRHASGPRSTSGSPPTTSIARAASIAGRGRSASRRCSPRSIRTSSRCRRSSALVCPARATPKRSARRSAWAGSWRPTRELRRHQFGNAVLSRYPIREHTQIDLTWKTCEPRCSQRVAVDLGDGLCLQVYNAHLGTALLERRYQAPRLAGWIHDRRVPDPKIVLGDFNEWGRGLVADVLAERLSSVDLYPHLEAAANLPRVLSAAAPRPHLLQREHRDPPG